MAAAPVEDPANKGRHRRKVRDLALPQRLDERADARLVARDRHQLAARGRALVPEAAARKLAGEDRRLALPEHVEIVHHVIRRRVVTRVHDERTTRQVELGHTFLRSHFRTTGC